MIDRDGTIYQCVPLNEAAWHAGGPTSKLFGKGEVNSRSVGIELMNYGPLDEKGIPFANRSAAPVKNAICLDACGYKYWEAYPEAQLAALESLLDDLPHVPVVDHHTVDPTRKIDCKNLDLRRFQK